MSLPQSKFKFQTDKLTNQSDAPVLLPHLSVELSDINSKQRDNVETYIANQFYKSHKADVTSFMPYLLSAETSRNITSAIGFRLGNDEKPLFLEQYLDNPADLVVSQLLASSIQRNQIAEIGNLTSSFQGSSQMLFVLIISVLHKLGIRWALFTATLQVQEMVSMLGIDYLKICDARAEQLSLAGNSWGSYYKNHPTVIAGNIEDAYHTLQQHPVAGFMMKNYQSTINDIVAKIGS